MEGGSRKYLWIRWNSFGCRQNHKRKGPRQREIWSPARNADHAKNWTSSKCCHVTRSFNRQRYEIYLLLTSPWISVHCENYQSALCFRGMIKSDLRHELSQQIIKYFFFHFNCGFYLSYRSILDIVQNLLDPTLE